MKKLALKLFGIGALAMFGFGLFGFNGATEVHAQTAVGVDQGLGDFGQLSQTEGLALAGAGSDYGDSSFINIIKNFINWTLGILGLIALVVLLYGGFNMVTAAGDEEKYKKGFKILKQAAVGLIFIGVAFFLVSIILWLVRRVGGGGQGGGAPTA